MAHGVAKSQTRLSNGVFSPQANSRPLRSAQWHFSAVLLNTESAGSQKRHDGPLHLAILTIWKMVNAANLDCNLLGPEPKLK